MMRLFYSATSPYARKARIAAIEAGVAGQIELVAANPLGDHGQTAAINPLGKIPALQLPDGRTLYASVVIAEYFDTIASAGLFPNGQDRFDALTRHALAQGVMDAAFAIVMELRRPENERSAYWIERWSGAIARSLDVMDARERENPSPFDIGWIAQAAAVGYVAFRLPALSDAARRSGLASWWDGAGQRQSVAATHPGS